jgi:hypothetical protein
MVYQIYKINSESDKWIQDLLLNLLELKTSRVRIYIKVEKRYDEIRVMENIFTEDHILSVKFLGTEELIIRIEPDVPEHYIPIIVDVILMFLTHNITKTVQYLTEKLVNDISAPSAKIEFLI